ncbi:uncharacterized protein LOC126315399 isoform X2 [Schistocerca gregaria]|uniref:uncharacterized protein LOC126315399 isoform X2 n=1 Tax=Schistocerca gregaria TaxID=7010 RepID=UPI00211F42F2|nr:uncharacterized protein LOC126315399 isoform X2 [Schistocerca gregaria]
MHIKKVLIRGIKSYSHQADFDPFSSKTNVIVGKNGAGKSNFIDVLCFVLGSSRFHRMRSEDRQAFLHKGPGEAVFSGYAELHFENSDKRFPVESSEVSLRRVIGLKKDEYYLNNKHISPDEVASLFESAGFSRSNPYNIVMQGQVQTLARMSPGRRLELLKEVAGARLYDEKRSESLRILEDTATKCEKIEQVLDTLEERLLELDAERDELREYQKLDRERRALEYRLKEQELREVSERLERVGASRGEEVQRAGRVYGEFARVSEELKVCEKERKLLQLGVAQESKERELVNAELQGLLRQEAELKLAKMDMQDVSSRTGSRWEVVLKRLEEVERRVEEVEGELRELEPRCLEALDRERSLKSRLIELEGRVEHLRATRGRSRRFRTREERDGWLSREVRMLRESMEGKESRCGVLRREISELERSIEGHEGRIERYKCETGDLTRELEQLSAKYAQVRERRDAFADRRKELWRLESELETEMVKCRQSMARAEYQLESGVSRDLSLGLASVRRIAVELNLRHKVYGPLFELFEVEEEYVSAVEAASGVALFHVVVDTDETASRLLSRLNEEKCGRVTFMPLNRVQVRMGHVGLATTEQVQPLTGVLSYDHARFGKVFEQVFGKVMLCQSLEVGTQIARAYGVSCVTLDGDRVNSKGALTGGYYDSRRSKIRLIKELRASRERQEELEGKLGEAKRQLSEVDQRVTQIVDELGQFEARRVRVHDLFEVSRANAQEAQVEVLAGQEQLRKMRSTLSEQEKSARELGERVAMLERELGLEMPTEMSSEEEEELSRLEREREVLEREAVEVSRERGSLECSKAELESSLTSRWLPLKAELKSEVASLELERADQKLAPASEELVRVRRTIKELRDRVEELDQSSAEKARRLEALARRSSELRESESEQDERMQEMSKKVERLINTHMSLVAKKNELTKRMREVGSVPSDTLEKFRDLGYAECFGELQKTKLALEKYAHVNKKALDQYMNFAEERDRFTDRKQQMSAESEAVHALIRKLDMQKDEAIERTFKGVSKYFSEVFTELTGGRAALVMQTSEGGSNGVAGESAGPRIRFYKGVDIRVSFAPPDSASRFEQLNQLSGGQQSVVALALIFAIQRCDPAPFYIFDEIDPALDERHRLAVAKMITKLSENVQFIITTHRPEMVQCASKCYLIQFENKVSNVVSASVEEALEMIRVEGEGGENIDDEQAKLSKDMQSVSVSAFSTEIEEEAPPGEGEFQEDDS